MYRELFVSRLGGQLWSALREDGSTVELRVERGTGDVPAGRIFKARVTRVLPGIQSAFLDVGTERGALLHARDLVLPGETLPARTREERKDSVEGELPPPPARRPILPIEGRLTVGRELLVQVSREPLGTKGARVTSVIGIPGRLVVFLPQEHNGGVSRRIEDDAERERLREILDRLPGENVGYVARTAAAGAGEQELQADAAALMREWCEIQDRAASLPAPSVVYHESGLLLRLLRETPSDGLKRVVVDDADLREQALNYARLFDPSLASLVTLHTGATALFESYGLHDEIEKALRRRVWLKSGGHLVIDETEALVSIDVNTGKFVGKCDVEQTALRINLEAAREIARQLRLRDLGGIIVIDFVDVEADESRRRIVEELKLRLRSDASRTKIIGLSELGLLQLTRKRTRPAVSTMLTRTCPLCAGRGRIKAPRTLAAEVLGALRGKASSLDAGRFVVKVHPDAARGVLAGLVESEFSPRGSSTLRVEVETDRDLRPDRFELNEVKS